MAASYGSFVINDNVNYFLTVKPTGTTKIEQVISPIARLEGGKVSGQATRWKTFDCTITVVGSSRSDLESKLDALYQALNVPNQHLTLHTADNRYFIATALYQEALLNPDTVVATQVKVNFNCQQPYAYAASSSSYDTGSVAFAQVGSVYQSPNILFPGGGNVFCRPTIVLTNQRQPVSTQITSALTVGNPYTSLSVNALTEPLYAGDVITLQYFQTPPVLGLPSQEVTMAANASIGATTLTVNSFTANYSYPINSGGFNPSGTQITNNLAWTQVVIQQTTDNQYFAFTGNLVPVHGNTLTIVGDPTAANGWTIIDSSQPATLIEPIGTPPQLDYGNTSWMIQIASSSLVIAEVQWSWVARWLS